MDSSVKIQSSGGAPKRILIAPLDWGLGHTSRCVPLIRQLLKRGHDVTLAGNESQHSYYAAEFPGIEQLLLQGYDIRYGKTGTHFALQMARQIPKILAAIRAEHQWLKALMVTRHFDGILSDNRYGLHAAGVPSVILTHQLRIQSGMGPFADGLLQRLHYRLLGRFAECWVPDLQEVNESLAGALSHPENLPPDTKYAGWLSALLPDETVAKANAGILVLLSGPEPQRTLLSDILWEQFQGTQVPVTFIEGSTTAPARQSRNPLIRHFGRVAPHVVQTAMAEAGTVVCRSGYSTLMDIGRAGCRAILIPTPGQTEQEYLAQRLLAQGRAIVMQQSAPDLQAALKAVAQIQPLFLDTGRPYEQFIPLLDGWLHRL